MTSPASAAAITTTRYAGADRYGTAADIATGVFGTSATAILATGLNFPDALAGAYLAGALNAPLLLTDPNTLSPETAAALGTLKTQNVIVLGGSDAVSDAVVTSLEATASTASAGGNLTVTRISGATRFDTAAAIDSTPAATTIGSVNGKKTAILATGDNFPDALFGGPLSYSSHFPLILTDTAALSPQAQTELTGLGIQQVIILGGTAAVSSAVESTVNGLGITTLFRAAGATRDDTAAKLLAWETTNIAGVDKTSVYIARDDSPDGFADALAMGPAAGKLDMVGGLGAGAPGGALPAETTAEITAIGNANATAAGTLYIPGGTAAVSDAQAAAAASLLSGTSTAAQTTLPQLISSKILTTVTTSNATATIPAGTYVQFVFSQNIGTAILTPASFKVYPATGGAGFVGTFDGVDPTNADAVDVGFTQAALQTTTGAAGLTLAAIVGPPAAAVVIGTLNSPAGAVPIGTAVSGAGQAGVTSGPDLQSVGNFRTACGVVPVVPCATNLTAVDFTFNKPAFIASAGASTQFNLVYTSAADPNATAVPHPGPVSPIPCTGPAAGTSVPASGGTVAGGNGTTVITVVCATPVGGTTPITAAQIARGYVTANTVATAVTAAGVATCPANGGPAAAPAGATCNPQEATITPHSSSLGPDLTTVAIVPHSNGGTNDSVVFTFNQPITAGSATTSANFGYYTSSGTAVFGIAGQTVQNPADSAQVSLNVASGATITAVGGIVLPGVVGGNSGILGVADALGAPNPATSAIAPGVVTAPQLTNAAVLSSSNVFGVASNSVLMTWSMNLANPGLPPGVPNAALIHAYDADGTEMTCQVGNGSILDGSQGVISALQPNESVCSAFFLGTTGALGGTVPAAGQVASIVLVTTDAGFATGAAGTTGATIPNPEGAVKA
jgi:putative cell wall-binding protein